MARFQPVELVDNGRIVGVMVPASDYENMRVFYADRMIRTMACISAQAAASGLTQEKLDDLLADES